MISPLKHNLIYFCAIIKNNKKKNLGETVAPRPKV